MKDRIYRDAYYECLRNGKPLHTFGVDELVGYYICTLAEGHIKNVAQDMEHDVIPHIRGNAVIKLLEVLGYRR